MSRGVATAGLIILVLLWVAFQSRKSEPALSPATVAAIDTLDATKPAFDSALVASKAKAEANARAQAEKKRLEASHRRAADSAQRVADSLSALAQSAEDWQDAYVARTEEADQLRRESHEKDGRIALLEADTARLSQDNARTLERLAFAERLNTMIRSDVAKINECAVIRWPVKVPCPTRTQTAIGSFGLGWLASR